MGDALTLHEDPCSGNCHKIKLTAALLGLPLTIKQYDIRRGETRTPEFVRSVNANGRIPVLQIGDGEGAQFLPESNAACWYLASGSALIPEDRFAQADTLRWMFFEQYNHEPNVATLRFWLHFVGEADLDPDQRTLIPGKRASGEAALGLLDEHLAHWDFLCGDAVTLADLILYPYSSVADQGGFQLSDFQNLQPWLERIENLPGFIPFR